MARISLDLSSALVQAILIIIAVPFAAAASPPACAAQFTARDATNGAQLFVYRQPDPITGGLSSFKTPISNVRCSPAGRIIVILESDDPSREQPSHDSISITIIDPASRRVLFDDLVKNYDLSPDNRLMVFNPWGGVNGTGDVLSGQTLSLLDMDGPPLGLRTSDVAIYPAGADAFHPKYQDSGKDQHKYWDDYYAWFNRFETMPHPATGIFWQNPRRFSFLIAKEFDDTGRNVDHQPFQTVTVTVDLSVGKPPGIQTRIVEGPVCANALPPAISFAAAVTSCAVKK